MTDQERPFAKDYLGRDVYLAPSDEIKEAGSTVDRLLEMLASFMGWEDGGEHVFVSDESTLGDFCLDDDDLEKLSIQVGFKVGPGDYVYDIANRMRHD